MLPCLMFLFTSKSKDSRRSFSKFTNSRTRNLLLRSGAISNIRILEPKKEPFSSNVEDPQLNMFSGTPLGPEISFLIVLAIKQKLTFTVSNVIFSISCYDDTQKSIQFSKDA